MTLLDLHSVYDATGSTDTVVSENNSNAAIPANDGSNVIGLSPFGNATLLGYGATVGAAAQALVTIGMSSNNLVDPVNKLLDTARGTDTRTCAMKWLTTNYARGPNLVQYAQEAAGVLATFKIDLVQVGSSSSPSSYALQNIAEYTINSGACTAGVYQSTAFAPSPTPPVGVYRILGARVCNVLFAAAIRFTHADFAGAHPGFPVVSYSDQALTIAGIGGNFLTSDQVQGYQFLAMSQALGIPCCPQFTIQGQGTGLNVEILDVIADTPTIDLIIQKLS